LETQAAAAAAAPGQNFVCERFVGYCFVKGKAQWQLQQGAVAVGYVRL
jgi:hypothetical protein